MKTVYLLFVFTLFMLVNQIKRGLPSFPMIKKMPRSNQPLHLNKFLSNLKKSMMT